MNKTVNPLHIWKIIRKNAQEKLRNEPDLSLFLHKTILNHQNLTKALSYLLADKLKNSTINKNTLNKIFTKILTQNKTISLSASRDIRAVYKRDPACRDLITPFLFFKGFHALQAYRLSHELWKQNRKTLALYIQSRGSEIFGVDIHPAAQIGSGILMDHATGIVIGETAIVENNVSILHEVSLGGTGKERGDRHPKIRANVLIGAGAKILGNIEIGKGAKIGAGSVVLKPVPPHHTVAGVPAKIIGTPKESKPSLKIDQQF